MSPELDLLEQLDGSDMSYMLIERHVFDGDRGRSLRSIGKMQAARLIVMAIGGLQVEAWRLAAWRRSPDDPATTSALEHAELSITDRGVERLVHGR